MTKDQIAKIDHYVATHEAYVITLTPRHGGAKFSFGVSLHRTTSMLDYIKPIREGNQSCTVTVLDMQLNDEIQYKPFDEE